MKKYFSIRFNTWKKWCSYKSNDYSKFIRFLVLIGLYHSASFSEDLKNARYEDFIRVGRENIRNLRIELGDLSKQLDEMENSLKETRRYWYGTML